MKWCHWVPYRQHRSFGQEGRFVLLHHLLESLCVTVQGEASEHLWAPCFLFVVTGDDLMRCVDLYNQSQSKWFEEMVTTSLVRTRVCCVHEWEECPIQISSITLCCPRQELERLEVERVEMIRQHLCQYTTLRHETDMFNQSVSATSAHYQGINPSLTQLESPLYSCGLWPDIPKQQCNSYDYFSCGKCQFGIKM